MKRASTLPSRARVALWLAVGLLAPCRVAMAQAEAQAPAPAPVASDASNAQAQAAPAPVEPWPGGLASGLDELGRRIAARDHAGVRELVDRLEAPDRLGRRRAEWLAAGGWRAGAVRVVDPAIEHLRLAPSRGAIAGELALVDGVAAERLGQLEAAQACFLVARADGRGATRLEAIDALADLELAAAEALRPAPGGAPVAAPTVAPPGAAAAGAAEDPIAKARAAYLVARARLVERLRVDRRDADARANLELVQRRLEELRQAEDQRREQQKQQQEGKQDQQDRQDKQDKQDQQQEQQEQQQQQQDQQQPKDEQQPSEGSDKKDEAEPPQPAAAMSKEEAQKLLDKLKELEEKGEELRATLLKAQRQKVDKDW